MSTVLRKRQYHSSQQVRIRSGRIFPLLFEISVHSAKNLLLLNPGEKREERPNLDRWTRHVYCETTAQSFAHAMWEIYYWLTGNQWDAAQLFTRRTRVQWCDASVGIFWQPRSLALSVSVRVNHNWYPDKHIIDTRSSLCVVPRLNPLGFPVFFGGRSRGHERPHKSINRFTDSPFSPCLRTWRFRCNFHVDQPQWCRSSLLQ